MPEFLKWYWTNALRDFKSKSRGMAWRRWIGLMERSRLAWLCEWRRAWMAFGGPSIYRSIELGDVIEISLHEEGWAFANTDPRRKIERRAGRGRWRGDDLTQWWSWHRLGGPDQWEGLAYLRAYLGRKGLAHWHALRQAKKRSPFLSWATRTQTNVRSVTHAVPLEDNALLEIAIDLAAWSTPSMATRNPEGQNLS